MEHRANIYSSGMRSTTRPHDNNREPVPTTCWTRIKTVLKSFRSEWALAAPVTKYDTLQWPTRRKLQLTWASGAEAAQVPVQKTRSLRESQDFHTAAGSLARLSRCSRCRISVIVVVNRVWVWIRDVILSQNRTRKGGWGGGGSW